MLYNFLYAFFLLQGDTIYLLYAYHPMDPTGENDIPQHQFRQSMIINLFGSIVEPSVPSDAQYLDILADSVRVYVFHVYCIQHCMPCTNTPDLI